MEKYSLLVIYAGVTLLFVGCSNCVSYYTIVAPEHIRPHSDYQLAATLHNAVEPVTIRFAIEDGLNYKNAKQITIDSNRTELVTLHIDDLIMKGYKLIAEGLSGIIFKDESNLKIESKNMSIFIQTDKAIYKPGETIKFRVLILDAELKPVSLDADNLLSIYFTDPKKNRIKQWLKSTPTMGVFKSEVQLSEQPILGDWEFKAVVGPETKTKTVEVAEYVLPKFEVTIDSPTDFSAKDDKIRAIIRSKYTYGKLVKGEAIVTLTPKPIYRWDGQNDDDIVKRVPVNGKGSVEFNVQNELKSQFSQYIHERNFDLQVTVVEELTGRNQSATKSIKLHQSRYKITTSDVNRKFTKGTSVTFSVSVTHHDNSPVLITAETKPITILKTVNRYTNEERKMSYKFDLNGKGMADITIPTSTDEWMFNLDAKYMDEETEIGNFDSYNPEPSDLEVTLLTKRPILNQNILVEVKSKDILHSFTYQVIAHGKIIYAENVNVPEDTKRQVIKIKATFDLIPKANIIVYRFKDDNIVAKKVEVTIDEDLKNFAKIKLSTTGTQPGNEVSIDIHTNPESYVGLMGVDQSVLLLKKNNGLTKDDVFAEMEEYQKHFYNAGPGPWSVRKHEYINEYFKPFEKSYVILFTNAKKDTWQRYEGPHYHFEELGLVDIRLAASTGWSRDSARPVSSFSNLLMSMAPNSFASDRILGGTSEIAFDDDVFNSSTKTVVEPPRIRTEFPETWLWEDFNATDSNGKLTITKQVPDTITSWVISAFSVDSKTGFGLTKNVKTLKVFQPFFISLNLPYSVKRGEVVAVPVVLFNYLDTDIVADLTLHNENGDFEFVDDNNSSQTLRHRQVKVSSDAGSSATFLIRFISIGQISLKVTATSAVAGDAIVRILQVDPEGVPQYVNNVLFVDLRESSQFDVIQNVEVPMNVVSGSLKINVNAIGDLLGGSIENMHQLIRLPTGCGEQNMLNFVPNIVVLDYLISAGNLNVETKDKATKFLVSGYQRELSYCHDDGSYSAFGKSDQKGSTWLTAFVAKSFRQAEQYIDIDENVIDKALRWLSSVQATDGSFPEVGHILDHKMQGGSSKGVALTAYATITFLENKDSRKLPFQQTVTKALDNIVSNINDIDDAYALAIAAYALQLAEHPIKDQVLNKLVAKSIFKDQHKWWTKSQSGSNVDDSKSTNVEITSYGVLALFVANRTAEAFPFFKWLLAQRNDRGGFVGTQDTVLGLQALAAYGQFLSNKNTNVQLKIRTDTIDDKTLVVNRENSLILQTIDLPSETNSVQINATGHGFALFQLSYRYNVNGADDQSTFTLTPKVLDTTAGFLNVENCASFNSKAANEQYSNMVIMEVAMPSGFLIEKDQLNELLKKPHVKRVEVKRGETVADIYIDRMAKDEELCIEVQGYRSHKIAENKPVPVRIYDYYDSSRSAREFYEIMADTSCNICEADDCPNSCKNVNQ